MAEQETTPAGLNWTFVPRTFWRSPRGQMPNWSHGLAGVAGSLAAAGIALDRHDLVDAARLGAEHLVSLADTTDGGLRVAHVVPDQEGLDTFTYTWCHGPAGTSLLFAALDRAGVPAVGDRTPYDWSAPACTRYASPGSRSALPRLLGQRRSLLRDGGRRRRGPQRLAAARRSDEDLAFASTLADAIVERAIRDGDHTYWRFVEHRNEDPLLPPGAGLDAGRGRDRGVPLPPRARPRAGPRRSGRRTDGHVVGAAGRP